MRTFIFLTLGVVFLPIALYWGVVFLYTPDDVPTDFSVRAEDFELTSADAGRIAGSIVYATAPSGDPAPGRPLVLFVADRSLDRDWNSRSFDFDSGRRLARWLGGAGIHSVRYDHRGTGSSRASTKSVHDLNLQADDLSAVFDYAAVLRAELRASGMYLLAHDSGCNLSLLSFERYVPTRELDGLVLLACGGPGTMLDHWGAKVLHNMQRSGAAPELVARAQQEWRYFREHETLMDPADTPGDFAGHPDLLAFRATMEYIASEDLRSFREPARTIEFSRGIRRLTSAGVPVLHLTGGTDEELPQTQADALRVSGVPPTQYRYVQIEDMNHFLKPAEKIHSGLPLVLDRMNPLTPLHKNALQIVTEFILM